MLRLNTSNIQAAFGTESPLAWHDNGIDDDQRIYRDDSGTMIVQDVAGITVETWVGGRGA